MNTALVIGLLLLVLGLGLHIAAVATHEWSTSEVGTTDLSGGLWKFCRDSDCQSWTSDMKEYFDERLKIVRGFAIIGLAAAGLAVMLLIPAFFKGKKLFHFVAGGMAIFAFVAILVSDIVWVAAIKDDLGIMILLATRQRVGGQRVEIDQGFSFALSVTGAVLILLGGIVCCLKSVVTHDQGRQPPAVPLPMTTMNAPPQRPALYYIR